MVGSFGDLGADPRLHPELENALVEVDVGGKPMKFIRHPLLVEMYFGADSEAQQYNRRFELKQEHADRLLAEKQFCRYLGLVERPFRTNMFSRYERDMKDDEYWQCLAYVWTDCENPTINIEHFLGWFKSDRSNKEQLYAPEDVKFMDSLPERFQVYRSSQEKSGLAWTTDLSTAEFFSQRYNFDNTIFTATVNKSDVLAFFAGRNESEVVINVPTGQWRQL